MKALVIFGGGIDGTVCTAEAVNKYGAENVKTISFFYGQRYKRELEFAKKVSDFYKVDNICVDISDYFKNIPGTLLAMNADVSKGTYEERLKEAEKGTLSEFVPCRGPIFFSIASLNAVKLGIDLILDPMNAESSHNGGFKDVTPEFAGYMQKTVYDGSGKVLRVEVPFMTESKGNVVKKGAELGVPFDLTFGCYEGREKPCGICLNCRDRKKAFKDAGLKDPTVYEVM